MPQAVFNRPAWLTRIVAGQAARQQAKQPENQLGALDRILGTNPNDAELMRQTSPEFAFQMQDRRVNPMAAWY